jgi:hypothetical protein
VNFDLTQAIQILERTPDVLETLLKGLPDEFIFCNEGENTFSAFDVMGHLIHGEKTDWMTRAEIILHNDDKHFAVYDRFAQYEESKGKSLNDLLSEFKNVRKGNLSKLKSYFISSEQLKLTGIHPKFGNVTLHQLLATWVTHDLAHIAQICRVMAKHYKEDAGPWVEYMRILQS